ncbi:MAG: YbaB/EbfC family nucleoid-associated protein [Bacteroidota bacterium]
MFGNISQLLEVKKKADELKARLETITVTETTGGITIDCNGNRKILAIHIDTNEMADKNRLEEHLTEAMNKALEAAERASMKEVGAIAGGMGLFGK